MKLLLTLLLLASCSKEFILQDSNSIENFSCPAEENCLSSTEKEDGDNYIMPFKMLGEDPTKNLLNIQKVLTKLGTFETKIMKDYLIAKNEDLQLEFIAQKELGTIEIRTQVKKQSFFSGDKGRKMAEKVRFNFFQGDF